MSVLQSFKNADLRLEVIEQLGGEDRARDGLDGHSSACLLLAGQRLKNGEEWQTYAVIPTIDSGKAALADLICDHVWLDLIIVGWS